VEAQPVAASQAPITARRRSSQCGRDLRRLGPLRRRRKRRLSWGSNGAFPAVSRSPVSAPTRSATWRVCTSVFFRIPRADSGPEWL